MQLPLVQLPWELEWLNCNRCEEIVPYRTQVVPGYGNPGSRFLFFGEAPGETEDRDGWPFVGKAGSRLRTLLYYEAGLSDHEFFLNNVVLCRPTLKSGELHKNRPPKADEIQHCWERVEGTIYETDPLLIVALGAVALRTLTGETSAISKARGTMFRTTIKGIITDISYPVFATYHPSFLNNNYDQLNRKGGCWDQMIGDLQMATAIYDALWLTYSGEVPPDRRAISEQRKENATNE